MSEPAPVAPLLFCAKRFRQEERAVGQLTDMLAARRERDFGLEIDAFKIGMVSSVRRLQQKTQVFPLDVTVAARSRLTHSLEVGHYARIIGLTLAERCAELTPYLLPMLTALANAAMLHDVGNPPFGHFGEALLRHWLAKVVASTAGAELRDDEKEDLRVFNGNAQSLRLCHSIQELNLTLGQYASFIKIPFTVADLLVGSRPAWRRPEFARAHAGVFLAEKPLLEAVRSGRRTAERHPFAQIIEWADDLAYTLADLEDAYERGLLSPEALLDLCRRLTAAAPACPLTELLDPARVGDLLEQYPSRVMFYLRDAISAAYVQEVVAAAAADLPAFLAHGEPADGGADPGPGRATVAALKQYEQQRIYTHREVQALELAGAGYLRTLLHDYGRLLTEDRQSFGSELDGTGGDPWLRRLAGRISLRHRETYRRACAVGFTSEMYARVRLLVDYISGMTDTYAEAEGRLLAGK